MAAFSFTVNGTVVSFVNESTDATSFLWNFGDGTSSTAVNPNHDYGPAVPPDTTQQFTVTLTATNPEGSDSVTRLVQVMGPASAAP